MALTTLNLSGIKAGDSLNISVSQGGLTAGPYSVGSWGGGGAGGTIAVNAVHRSYRQIAPDGVQFEVDLSSATFDTAGPTGSEVYDARLHDLYYFWTFGDPGTWTAPVNVLTEWKNRNTALGPKVRHLYRAPGNYTVSVLVIEPSSGRTATAETTVSVGDPQDFYGDANTIYVNNVNDNDFSDVPAGVPEANKINVDSLRKVLDGSFVLDATWANFDGGHAKRWRFKRGGSWEFSVYLTGTDTPDIMFDDYGDAGEADPVLNVFTSPESSELTMLRAGYGHDQASGRNKATSPPDLRVRNIKFKGHFDPTVNYAVEPGSERSGGFWIVSGIDMAIADCTFDGFGGSIIVMQCGTGTDYTGTGKMHLDNCIMTNFGGEYQTTGWNTGTAASAVAMTGCRVFQPGNAISTETGTDPDNGGNYGVGSRSIGRYSAINTIHLRGCDFHMMDKDLGHFQFGKNAQEDGYVWNVHSCTAEMGSQFIGTDGGYSTTPQQRGHVHNIIIDGCIYASGWTARSMVALQGSGLTMRNCIMYDAGTPRLGNGVLGIVEILEANASGSPLPDFMADAPVKVYNCTLYMEREALENSLAGNWRPEIYENNWADLTAVTESNNVMHMPNYSIEGDPTAPYIIYAPITENVLWAPRTLGYRPPSTLVLDTSLAFAADIFKDAKPGTGSTALNGATTGDRAFTDITGASRYGAGVYTEGTVDRGAWQVS